MRAITRFQAVLVALVLLVAACGDDAGGEATTTTTIQDTTTTIGQGTTTTTVETTTTTTEAAAEPVEVELDPPPPEEDPDPLLTILPLQSVTIAWDVDGNLVFTLPESEFDGFGITITNVEGAAHVGCDAFDQSTGCNAQTAEGFVIAPPTDHAPGTAPNSLVAAMTVTMDSVTLTIEGEEYTGDGVLFSDGAGMVQIDPSTGGLAEPVTRRQGFIAAVDLYAALYG